MCGGGGQLRQEEGGHYTLYKHPLIAVPSPFLALTHNTWIARSVVLLASQSQPHSGFWQVNREKIDGETSGEARLVRERAANRMRGPFRVVVPGRKQQRESHVMNDHLVSYPHRFAQVADGINSLK